jgi:GNAT superfamily N-acetyltransferase
MKIEPYGDRHRRQLLTFIRQVWDDGFTEEHLDRQLGQRQSNPFWQPGADQMSIALQDDRVVGHIARTPCGFWLDGREYAGHWLSGLMVLPDSRGAGLGKSLPRHITRDLDLVTGFLVIEASFRIFSSLGWRMVGKMPEYMKIIQPLAFVRKLDMSRLNLNPRFLFRMFQALGPLARWPAGILLAGALRARHALRRVGRAPLPAGITKEVEAFDDRVDALWQRARHHLRCAQVRNAAYMNWNFDHADGWIKLVHEGPRGVDACAVLFIKRLERPARISNVTVASIVELLWDFDHPTALHALLDAAGELSRARGAHALLCALNHEAGQRELKRAGYLPIPSSVHFIFWQPPGSAAPAAPTELKDWYLTRGDADAVGSLGPHANGGGA